MKKYSLFIALLFLTCLSFAQDQKRNFKLVEAPTENPTNQKRKAVVIGMSDYGAGRSLNNTLNDAYDMKDVLIQLGFEVTLLTNNDMQKLDTNLKKWHNTIDGNDMAIFYFAGHGVEVYVIPVGFTEDAVVDKNNPEVDLKWNTLNVNKVLDYMNVKQVGLKLIILDACRDNPFKRSWSRGREEKGLAQMAAPEGTTYKSPANAIQK